METVDSFELNDGGDEAYRLYRQAREEMDAGKFVAAIELFEQSNHVSPHYKTCQLMGECFVRLNRHQDAVVPLAAATALNRQGIAPTLLAEVFLTLNEPDKAHEFAQLAIERQPHYKPAHEIEAMAREANERRMREL